MTARDLQLRRGARASSRGAPWTSGGQLIGGGPTLSRQCGAIDRDKPNVILEAAIDVAGGARPSLAAVASRARVSRQTVYNQFGGAQGVRRAVLNWCEAALREPFETFPAQSETRTALAAYAESALRHVGAARYHRAIRAVGRVLPDDKTLPNAICAEISEACTSSLRDFLEREMRAGTPDGRGSGRGRR